MLRKPQISYFFFVRLNRFSVCQNIAFHLRWPLFIAISWLFCDFSLRANKNIQVKEGERKSLNGLIHKHDLLLRSLCGRPQSLQIFFECLALYLCILIIITLVALAFSHLVMSLETEVIILKVCLRKEL